MRKFQYNNFVLGIPNTMALTLARGFIPHRMTCEKADVDTDDDSQEVYEEVGDHFVRMQWINDTFIYNYSISAQPIKMANYRILELWAFQIYEGYLHRIILNLEGKPTCSISKFITKEIECASILDEFDSLESAEEIIKAMRKDVIRSVRLHKVE